MGECNIVGGEPRMEVRHGHLHSVRGVARSGQHPRMTNDKNLQLPLFETLSFR